MGGRDRTDDLEARLDAIEEAHNSLAERLDLVSGRLDEMLDKVEGKLEHQIMQAKDDVGYDIRTLEGKVDRLEGELDHLKSEVNGLRSYR